MKHEQLPRSTTASPADGRESLNQATARLAVLRDQACIKPDGDVPKPLSEKGLRTSRPSGYDFKAAEQRAIQAEDLKRRSTAQERMANAGLPARHAAFYSTTGEGWSEVASTLGVLSGSGYLSVLIGDRGRGKTQLGVHLIRRHILEAKGSAKYVKAMTFFIAIKSTYRKDSTQTEDDVIYRYSKTGLLVIDAAEVRSDSRWEDSLLSHLVDLRYDAGRDTIIIGNIKESEVTSALGHSIVSRANETGGVVVCDWPSYRETHR